MQLCVCYLKNSYFSDLPWPASILLRPWVWAEALLVGESQQFSDVLDELMGLEIIPIYTSLLYLDGLYTTSHIHIYIYIHKKCICSTVKLYDFLINPAILGRLQRNVHAGLVRFSSTLDPCHTVYPCRWRGDFRVVWDVLLPGWATFLWSPTVDVNFICTQNHTKVMFSSFV